jgi:N-acetylmuramoyl-L-alanine amidase/putative methionine-R-sulfoxide reductase with GAF domain
MAWLDGGDNGGSENAKRTSVTKPERGLGAEVAGVELSPFESKAYSPRAMDSFAAVAKRRPRPSGGDALQALLAFSALHQQVRQRRALASQFDSFGTGFGTTASDPEFEQGEQFVLDEVLQMVAKRAIAITGADGVGIALAENNEIVLRALAGAITPGAGARIERDSTFSGACFRRAEIMRCHDTETDDRVNRDACRHLGARSIVAVPLCGRRRVIGVLEAFSAEPVGFNESDVDSLELLAELIVAALKPEDEDRFAASAQVAEMELAAPATPLAATEKNRPQETVAALHALPAEKGVDVDPVESIERNVAGAHFSPMPEVGPAHESELKAEASITGAGARSRASRHPGIVLVLVLVVIAAISACALWWKLKNTQLGAAPVQSESMFEKPAGTAARSMGRHSAIPSRATAAGSRQSAVAFTDNSAPADLRTQAEPGSKNATPQELSKMPRVTGIRHWSAAESSTVVLDLEDQVQYEAHRLANPDRIYFDLHDTSLASGVEGTSIDISDGLLSRVRVAQPVSGLTRVVLETKGNTNFSVSLEPNPYRLVVELSKPGANARAQVNLFPGTEVQPEKLAIVVPPPTKEDLQMRARTPKMRIVVDAGHGGWDLGTVGRRGLLEKDVVLEIAQRLGQLLESRIGADVIFTRNDDTYIPLDARAAIANQAQADLFVSVHANYSDLPSARGVETYYTSFFSASSAKDSDARDPDHGKNVSMAGLSPVELHDKIEQSRRLAASVQRSLYATLSVENPGLRDRGVKEASYVVLTQTAMPGILAEVSFVSSPTDEQKLRSDGYREQIAEALYKGIARYAVASHGVKMASAAK